MCGTLTIQYVVRNVSFKMEVNLRSVSLSLLRCANSEVGLRLKRYGNYLCHLQQCVYINTWIPL